MNNISIHHRGEERSIIHNEMRAKRRAATAPDKVAKHHNNHPGTKQKDMHLVVAKDYFMRKIQTVKTQKILRSTT